MIHEAIYNTHDLVKSINSNEDGSYKAFDKDGKEITLDKNKVEAEVTRLQTAWDSQDYARKRKEEYEQMGNQFEMIFDDQDAWRNKINEIKAKYPKE